jgi:hypothetical protein
VDLVESTNLGKGYRVYVGYDRAFVAARHHPSHNAAVTTSPLLLAMLGQVYCNEHECTQKVALVLHEFLFPYT